MAFFILVNYRVTFCILDGREAVCVVMLSGYLVAHRPEVLRFDSARFESFHY